MWKNDQNTRFIFSPEAAAESLPTCSKESRPCAPSKSWSTREPSSACASPACRYGTTCEPSAQTIQSAPECSQTYANAATRLSLPGAFRVRIFHAREKARAYAAREADFGRNMRVSFAKFDPVSYSWKIPHFLFQGDLATYSQTWPRWGMMVHTASCRQVLSAQDTAATVFGEHSGETHEKQDVATDEKRGVVLSILREENGKAAKCRWAFGGLRAIFQTEVLLDGVPRQSGGKAGSEAMSSALARPEVKTGILRVVRLKDELARSPQRPQRMEQLPRELADALRELSQSVALENAQGTFEFSAEVNCYELPPWELSGAGIEDGNAPAQFFGTSPCRPQPRSAKFRRSTPNLGEVVEEENRRLAESAWPTPTAKGNGNRSEYGGKSGDGLDTAVKRAAESAPWPTPTCVGLDGGSHSRKAARARGRYIKGAGAKSATWPTPKCRDCAPTSRNQKPRDDLKCAVEMGVTKSYLYPTVGTQTMGGCSGSFAKLKELEEIGRLTPEERRAMSSHLTGGKDPDTANCGMLNPDWVEWLMGWPIWWTDVDFRNADGGQCVMPWLDLADDPAEWPTPLMQRITTRKTHRVHRIETLGNGQVPLCAAVAFIFGFEIVRVIIEGRKAA